MKVKTRFAPSPTGKLHIGNARTALFNYLFSRNQNGSFILRIDDTDRERSSTELEKSIIDDLKWLGIDWDEGPDTGGPNGPYRQSERYEIYREIAENLLKRGRAYECFCTREELEQMRQKAIAEGKPPMYDGRCRNLSEKEKQKFRSEGRKPVIRFRIYEERFGFTDLVRGGVVFPAGSTGDFVIMRSDMTPTYIFASAVDDALMGITHIIRAEDHLSNTLRQLMIWKAIGYKPPHLAHLPLVVSRNGKKLSKRMGDISIEFFKKAGYLPEAIVNYLALLGWTSPDAKEIMTFEELIKKFSIKRVAKGSAVFDRKRLDWIARQHLIDAPIDRIVEMAVPYFIEMKIIKDRPSGESADYFKKVVSIVRGYCSSVSEIPKHSTYFFTDNYEFSEEGIKFIMGTATSCDVIREFAREIENINPFNDRTIREAIRRAGDRVGAARKNLFMPIRIAITGQTHGPELTAIIYIIGKSRTAKRLKRFTDRFCSQS